MSAHVLLSLLNKLGKRGKMRGWLSILSLFATDFINSIIQESTNVRFYLSYGIKITFCLKTLLCCHYLRIDIMDVITFPENL